MTFNSNLISFFKRHNLYEENMFCYLSQHTNMIDYNDEEQRMFIGCFVQYDKNQKLKTFQLNIPYVYDEITMLISIHELIHGILAYERLNKTFRLDDTCETLPLLYEKIYMEESQNETLEAYQEKLNSGLNQNIENHKKYIIALAIREQLYQEYDYDIKKMKRLSKKLTKKLTKKLKSI